MKFSAICLLGILMLFVSCAPETVIEPKPEEVIQNRSYSNADERLWPFFQAFEIEAQSRGLTFDLDDLNILGVIIDIEQEGVAGHCKFGDHIDNEVTIDSQFWSRSSELYKEFIVFHELGHCVLLRDHDETIFNDGTCESLMRSGTQNCRDNYSTKTRERYLDELFSVINS